MSISMFRGSEEKAHRTPFVEAAYRVEDDAPKAADPQEGLRKLRAELKTELRTLKTQVSKSEEPKNATRELERELRAMQATLDEIVAFQNASTPGQKRDRAATLVAATGIEGPAAKKILRTLKAALKTVPANASEDDLREHLMASISDTIEATAYPLATEAQSLLVLVGPSGVGKTTTVAKLAANAILDHMKTVTIVSCDTFRVGASAQAARYAELMGAEFVAARDAQELETAIATATTDIVIIDTPGQIHDLPKGMREILSAKNTKRERHLFLCVPAATRSFDAERILRCFDVVEPTAIITTKLDETAMPAGIVHISFAAKIPVAAFCFGPRVPEDIGPATKGAMLERLVPRGRGA